MEIQQTYREHLTARIWVLIDEINKIHGIIAGKLNEMDDVGVNDKTIKEINCYFDEIEYLNFEIYVLDEVRNLLAK